MSQFFKDGRTAQHPLLIAALPPLLSLAKWGAITDGGRERGLVTIPAVSPLQFKPYCNTGVHHAPRALSSLDGRQEADLE